MIRKLFGLLGVLALLSGISVVTASADDNGYNQPPAVVDNCNAGHGAFGAFSHHFAFQDPAGFNWIADAAQQGGIGDTTGPTNSGFSQFLQDTVETAIAGEAPGTSVSGASRALNK